MNRFRLLGTSDDCTTCDCCGKANLKKTVVLAKLDGGGEVYYGVDCAAQALLGSRGKRRRLEDLADRAERGRREAARSAERQALFDQWEPVEFSPLRGHPTTFMPADLVDLYGRNPREAHAERARRHPGLF